MTFHTPSVWLLLLALILPLIWWRWRRTKRTATFAFSSTESLRLAGRPWSVRLHWLTPALRTAMLLLLIICIARPLKTDAHTRVFTEGIAIQLVLDRSGSMETDDFVLNGRRVTRLDAVKKVVQDFVGGGDDLPGRPDDLIGLITFGTYADSRCPLTLDHDHLMEAVRQTEIPRAESERGTAIGDAIALGVERLHSIEQGIINAEDHVIKSNVMILLTDGENTAGELDPMTAAMMASAFDIRIYTIGAGSDRPLSIQQRLRGGTRIDERTLKAIAEETGGRYFRATDSDSLIDIYAQIDELERTKIETQRYTEYSDMSVEAVRLGLFTVPPLLTVVLVLLGVELLLSMTRLRVLPA